MRKRTRGVLVTFFLGLIALAAIPPASATTIGPDAFGYVATNEIPFSFTNISGTGTQVLSNVDDAFTSAAMGFLFPFYGATYGTAFFSSNGLITFGAGSAQFTNENLSIADGAGNLPAIAVLWDDWVTFSPADAVYHQTVGTPGDRQFIVQWNQIMGFSSSPSTVTFQAGLFESGAIELRYLDIISGDSRNNGASATVGIRDTNGHLNGENLQWSFNSSAISDEEAIRFTVVPEPGSLLLLGSGVGALALRAGRKTKRRASNG